MENGFILGNGITRTEINLESLRAHGKTYGCNLIFEEFTPDVLVAVDTIMGNRIQALDYAKTNTFYTREPRPDSGAIKIEKNWAYSSGPVAITIACQDNIRYIYMLGFDLMGHGKINDNAEKRKFNNVYADRELYKKSTDQETHYSNWITQIASIMSEYADRKFIRVNPHLDYSPPEWLRCRNYSILSLKHFMKRINT